MARWKRGQKSQGVRQAIAYAFGGVCDATLTATTPDGVIAANDYADAVMTRYIVENGAIREDLLSRGQLKDWVDGLDPLTGELRGRHLESPNADLILDATINAPKSYSIAATLDPELNAAYEDLQDRLRDRIIKTWQVELNARRGVHSAIREDLARIEVVELKHERSRSLDPHKHRHLWLNVRVQGEDGRWSNLDTRVALRFQNVINAEGDLAARTDPAWITALASKGFTLNADGEIEQLAHLVRPLSKRAAQIEANKTARIAWWKEQHPGQEPSRDILNQIDRWAWAAGRPDKPTKVDEDDWAAVVRTEITHADPALRVSRRAVALSATDIADLDLELLAAKAIVDADTRSTGTGGRFSILDVRAGATRALAASGVVAEHRTLAPVVEEITARATMAHTVTLLTEPSIPAHVKRLMATATAALKVAVAHEIEASSAPGADLDTREIDAIAHVLEPSRSLDREQTDGAAAIAGTASVVAITGAAGTGKTTMLKVASAALKRHGRRMIIVAPTKKAASVAGRESASDATSLHQLLHDYGWRWSNGRAGNTEWARLRPGERDPLTNDRYDGPRIPIRPGDRILVDEAGMLDLEAAHALLDVIRRTRANVAVVGDDCQALPVGQSGAMALFRASASRAVELATVHRFRDPAWAELASRIRQVDGNQAAEAVAKELVTRGDVALAASNVAAQHAMVDVWLNANRRGKSLALVAASHEEAQEISEAIQAKRVESGTLATDQVALGQSDQPIYVGDIVQTRRNDSSSNVENRQSWVVRRMSAQYLVIASASDSSNIRRVTREYAASHLHLAYATTVYGVQGETTDLSVVGPGVDAAGLYVGLTRGREHNSAVVVATTEASAQLELASTLLRRPMEETLAKSREAARHDLAVSAQPLVSAPAAHHLSRQ